MTRQCNLCQRAARPNWALCSACADRLLIRVDDRRAPAVYTNAELFRAEVSPKRTQTVPSDADAPSLVSVRRDRLSTSTERVREIPVPQEVGAVHRLVRSSSRPG